MLVHRDHMWLAWVTSYCILQPSSTAVFLLTALHVYILTSAQAALELQIMPELGTADRKQACKTKFKHNLNLWLPSVSFEFNCSQNFVRTFHLSEGQAALHACRGWGLVIGKASIGPWNSHWLEKCTLKYAANFFIAHWIYKPCFKRDPPCSMRNSTLRYPFANDWREGVPQ